MAFGAASDLHSASLARSGGAAWLSLALIDARNHTLAWLAMFGAAGAAAQQPHERLAPPRWLALHAAWWQERWIARNPQRARGAASVGAHAPLASIEPRADAWCAPAASVRELWTRALPDDEALRAYLVETIEVTLDLLGRAGAGADDDALHFYRAALAREDRLVERFAALAQAQGLPGAAALLPPEQALAPREPLVFGATRSAGASAGGWRPANEAGDVPEPLPEFEIDAQALSWQQYVEFMADGGYDDERWWSVPGWAWLQTSGRRAPRDVEQWRHGVLVTSFGRPLRVSLATPVRGVTRHEAEAWCRWAGRRLPAGVEWQHAAQAGPGRGVVAGQVSEWVLGRDDRGRAWQRGLPWFAPRRLAHPARRAAVAADCDDGFAGFRSCAL
jgi:iron(II)-dependent oxidoreductase